MHIRVAQSDTEIAHCFPVMGQLRPHLIEGEFLAQVRQLMAAGYQLVYLEEAATIRAVAGFRIVEMLSRGRFLYVDDLVTDAAARSRGYGNALFAWLVEQARLEGCTQVDLDSGVQRDAAHRFYFRQGMHIVGFHFALGLPD
jgi:GNAT superfamily N-acetyltransferase